MSRLRNFDLNLLVYLNFLLEEQSVSKAADRAFLSQSAMSDALARMRKHFNDELLVQIGKKMVPTALAQSLHEPVRDVLMQAQAIASSTPQFDPATSNRRVRIMCSDYTVSVLFSKVIEKLWLLAPGIKLDFLAIKSDFREEFNRGNVDLLIIPDDYVCENHPSEPLFQENYSVIAWSGNRRVGETLSVDEYFELGHVCVSVGEGRIATYEAWFLERFGEEHRKVEVVVPTFGGIFPLIAGTERIATVHRRQAEIFAPQYSLKQLEPPFNIPSLTLMIQSHRNLGLDPALVWLRNLVKSVAAGIP